jgi:hypothetical protein
MTVLTIALLGAVFLATARLTYRARRRHHGIELHTQSPREVADNLRPHGADITVAPRTPPRIYDQGE